MPSLWANVDMNFPSFQKGEDVQISLNKLQNYMFALTEGLKYALENLDKTNWNSAALEENKIETTEDLVSAVQELTKQINSLSASLTSVQRIATAAGNSAERAEDAVGELTDFITPYSGDDEITIGGEGITVKLVGNITINGTPQ